MTNEPDSPPVSRVYRPIELPSILGITPAMVRRYSDVLETVTGDAIARDRRARIYTESQVQTLRDARALVDGSDGAITIEQAIKRVLGIDVLIEPPNSTAIQSSEPTPLEKLLESLSTISTQNAQVLENQTKMLEKQAIIEAQNEKLLERLDSLEGQNRVLLGDNSTLKNQLSAVKTDTEKFTAQKPKGFLARLLGR